MSKSINGFFGNKSGIIGLIKVSLSSEYAVDALRNTIAIILPIIFLWRYDLHAPAFGIGTGTLLISLTDLPGNRGDKIMSAWCSILVFVVVALLTALSLPYSVLSLILTVGMTFFLTMLGSLGVRFAAIGTMGVVVATFTLGLRPTDPFSYTFYILLGSLWYYIISLLQIWIFPYRSLNRAIEQYIKLMDALLKLRAAGYDPLVSLSGFNEKNIRLHLKLTAGQELIRQLLLSDDFAMRPNNTKGKILLQNAVDLIDLYEQVSAVHYDYPYLRKVLAESGVLPLIGDSIRLLANLISLKNTDRFKISFDDKIVQLKLLENRVEADVSWLIGRIITNLQEVGLLVTQIKSGKLKDGNDHSELHYRDFLSGAMVLNFSPFVTHISFRSPVFRFALRLSALTLVAMLAMIFFPGERYSYWLLLTIVIVSRPSYGHTRKRNWERLSGTLIGLSACWLLMMVGFTSAVQVTFCVFFLFGFFAFNRVRYAVSVFCITIAVVLFLNVYHGEPLHIFSGRIGFTILGGLLCVAATFLFPIWDSPRLKELVTATLISNKDYLVKAVDKGQGNLHQLRLARKSAYQSLAALSEGLQSAATEPFVKKINLTGVKQVQLLCYQLNALIPALTVGGKIDSEMLHSVLSDLEFCIYQSQELDEWKKSSTLKNEQGPMDLLSIVGRLKGYFGI